MAKRIIATELWTDKVWRKQMKSVSTRYLWLYLLTSPYSKVCGIYHLPLEYVQLDTKLSEDEVIKSLQELTELNLIAYSQETEEIAIFNFPRYNISTLIKPIIYVIRNDLKEVKDKSLIVKTYNSLASHSDNITLGILAEYEKYVDKEKETIIKENSNVNDNVNVNNNVNDNDNIIKDIEEALAERQKLW